MITVNKQNQPQTQNIQKGVQFVSPRHITNPKGHVAKITKVTNSIDNAKHKPDNFGNPYIVSFTMEGGRFSKGLKPSSDGTAALAEMFGADEAKWVGRSFLLGKSVDDDGGERLTFSPLK